MALVYPDGQLDLVRFYREEIHPRLSLEEVYADVEFATRTGRYWRGKCPLHGGSNPSSFSVDTQTLGYRCFGGCGPGDPLQYLNGGAKPRGREFVDLVKRTARMVGFDMGTPGPDRGAKHCPRPLRQTAIDTKADVVDGDTFACIAEILLAASPASKDADVGVYLHRRGLLDIVPADLGAIPASRARRKDLIEAVVAEVGLDAWLRSGLARDDGGFTWSAHRLVIPWRAPGANGQIQALQRRLLRDPRRSEQKYVMPRSRLVRWPYGIENAELIGPETSVVFCEGALDAIALHYFAESRGLDWWPLGLPGVDGWQAGWAALARNRLALVALDSDGAGKGKVEDLTRDLRQAGATDVLRVRPRHRTDWCAELEALREAGRWAA